MVRSKTASPPVAAPAARPSESVVLAAERPAAGSGEDWRYNPAAIASAYRGRYLAILRRLFDLIAPALSFGLILLWDRVTGSIARNEHRRAVQLRELLTNLGPTYIKIGQALSTRPDLISTLYLEELAQLQDQLPPFANEIAFGFIEEELGARPETVYDELSPEPVAAASLGQVYKGKLATGEVVAVKVQRPDLARRITLDVYILRGLAIWLQQRVKRLRSDLVAILDEFAARIFEEMNYIHEGQNAERFAELYGYIEEIYVPKIYWQYTGRRVLTMEWIDGTKLTKPKQIQAEGNDAKCLLEVGVECSLRQLLEYGFFHADPHPGNLLAMRDGRLAYLDFGMMSEIESYQRYGLIEAVVHLVNRDFESLANDYVQLEFLAPDTNLEPIVPALARVFNDALGASVAELNFKSITDQMSEVMYEFPFRVPAYYALIIRSLVTLEGIAIGIDPDFKVLSKAYPYIAKRLLTDPSPQLRASLRDLLFRDDSFRWNRLENLLRNARISQDYDFEKVLDQAFEFLFSERGAFIRERVASEVIDAVDALGQQSFHNLTMAFRERVGMAVNDGPPAVTRDAQNIEHFQRIVDILRETPGFNPLSLLPLVPQVLAKPETQRLGQQIASGLAQRAVARLIRYLLVRDVAIANSNDSSPIVSEAPKRVHDNAALLPPARSI
ncbi:putative unusual protein kinase [Rubidibacter lacunae KORDI 51-2]|uniref:Putative unusual protein kinase n=1 Tax=Rubidibacter lacunae KORDI 51-2 TaxID=582515 RepID=U5D824_9CHRO|nr:AarF/ABC1/UbiB kinase family protein [Rubidibacter lacunae]ERN40778.1 putative unusual protein kinase [Rubidibacter lacunae KORDI 51-2]